MSLYTKGEGYVYVMNFSIGGLRFTRSTRTADKEEAQRIHDTADKMVRLELRRDKYDRRPIDEVLASLWVSR